MSSDKLKSHLTKILEEIFFRLNSKGECIVAKIANLEHSAIFLKLIKNHSDPRVVQSYDVPVFTINYKDFEIDDWDLTTRKVKEKNYFINLKIRIKNISKTMNKR